MNEVESEGRSEPGRVDSEGVEAGLLAVFRRGPRAGESVLDALQRNGRPRAAIRLPEAGELHAPGEPQSRTHSHYTFSDEIGRGGVGVVRRGIDVDLGRDVALKVLREEYVTHPQALARFVEEAQIEGQLQHPGIIPVYELGMTDGGQPFFAMKLVKGKTLGELLDERGSLRDDRRRFLGIFEQTCHAMAYAHTRGVVHRDLKPSNVMVGSFGEVQVVDWGLAKVLGREAEAFPAEPAVTTVRSTAEEGAPAETRMGTALGTPSYMPREQAAGKIAEIDERSDVFALGAILLEILTGAPPYPPDAPNVMVLAYKAELDEAHARLDACGADEPLVDLCRACLAPEREARPQDAREVAETLDAYVVSVEERAHQAEVEAAKARVKAREERKARRLTLALAASILLALLLGGGGWLWIQSDRRARAEDAGRAAASALGVARERLGEARRAGSDDLSLWQAALDAAVRASEVATTGGATGDVITRAERLTAEIEDGQQVANRAAETRERDEGMTRRLEEIRQRRGASFSFIDVDADYAEAFREYGIDLDGADPDTAGSAIRASAIAETLCAALDDWSQVRIRHSAEEAKRATVLVATATAADPDPWRDRVRASTVARDGDELQQLRDEVDLAKQGPEAVLVLANGLVDTENAEAGVEVLEKIRTRHADDFWVHYQLGFLLLNLQEPQPDAALGSLRTALALNPDSVEVRLQLGAALRALKRPDEAISVLRELLEIQPDHTDATMMLFQTVRNRDRSELEAMLPALREAADAVADDPFPSWRYATALRQLFHVEVALGAYERAVAIDPDYAPAHFFLGFLHFYPPYGMRDLEVAAKHFEKATRLSPGRAPSWDHLAKTHHQSGKYAEAARAWEQARRAKPVVPRFHVMTVRAWFNAGDTAGALDAYRRLEERFPDHESLADLENILAHALVQEYRRPLAQEMAQKAIARLQKGLDAGTLNAPIATHWIALLNCDALDDFEAAKTWFEKALLLEESEPDLANLGHAYMRLGLLPRAIEQYRQGIDAGHDDPITRAFLGWALFVSGDLEGSLEVFETALEKPDPLPFVDLYAGLACLDLGRFEEGEAHLLRYQETAPWPLDSGVSKDDWAPFGKGLVDAARLRPAVERGEAAPLGPREQMVLATYGYDVARFHLACTFFEKAFAADPGLRSERLPFAEVHYAADLAAQAAAALLAGLGQDPPELTDAERAHWRKRALEWMRTALEAWELAVPEELTPPLAAEAVIEWRRHPLLAGLREERHLAKLAPDEAAAFRAYWADVEALIARIDDMRNED